MTRPMSRALRRKECLEVTGKMIDDLENWYDAHLNATFDEIEQKARQLRRTCMGHVLAVLVNGRDTGLQSERPRCTKCGAEMEFVAYRDWTVHGLEGDTTVERAYYVCPPCAGQTFFPLDHKLGLRHDHWSEGAARVATRQGLQAPSFAAAAQSYTEAVGAQISESSVRRVTEEMGRGVHELNTAAAEKAAAPPQKGETPRTRRLEEHKPVQGPGNLSSDGAKILIRGEGWKEIKLAALSQVQVLPPAPRRKGESHRRDDEPRVKLSQHSYVAGLWEADEFGKFQYAEGLRRGLENVAKLSSVNDGALWIERITATNFPHAVQIVDWSHTEERIGTVAQAVFGAGSSQATAWTEQQLDQLWQGQVASVVQALQALDLDQPQLPEIVHQSPGYFQANVERMRYDRFRAENLPIGSGTVENAAKDVVHRRMRRPGPGWKRENTDPMLAALCELRSDRFEYAWQRVRHLATKSHQHY